MLIMFLTLAIAIDLTAHVLISRNEERTSAEDHFRRIEFRHV